MKSFTITALTALLSTGALAVPMAGHGHVHAGRHANLHHNKRDIVWITEFEVETVTVMKTVYGDGSEPTNSPDTLSAAETPAPVTFTSYAAHTSSAAPVPTTTTTTTTTTPTVTPAAYTPPTTTTQAPAPTTTTTTSSYVAPAPVPETTTTSTTTTTTPTYQTPSKAATQPAPASSSAAAPSGGSYGGACTVSSNTLSTTAGSCHTGDFTYYDPSGGVPGGLGACGWAKTSSDNVVAVGAPMFDQFSTSSNNNPLCGKMITIYAKDGTTHTAEIVDRCPVCTAGALDMSEPLFNAVTSNGDGRVSGLTWSFN